MSISTTSGTTKTQRDAVAAFEEGWRTPHPQAWDDLLARDVVLEQPLLPDGSGLELWQESVRQLLVMLPDLTGRVVHWAADGDVLYLDVELSATLGGRPYRYRAIDRLTLDADGRVAHRRSFLDPGPLTAAIATRPRAWAPWWRSGLPPFPARRRIAAPSSTRERTVSALGATRVLVGLSALLAPSLARRSLGLSSAHDGDGTLARMFGVRDAALGLATSAGTPAVREAGLRLGTLADISDVVAVLLGRRDGVTDGGALLIGGAAATFALTGALAILAGPAASATR